ncbi:MAG TPA: PRC-barrel domain-containing protein [Chloroflexota bacterium]|nr:PRC-barrel domain-containing protein [Chloroflexota bacterium]
MIRASALYGRPVVDATAAEKLGEVAAVLLDPEARHLAGLVISPGRAMIGHRQETYLPASAIRSIGPDAIMVRGPQTTGDEYSFLTALASRPRVTDLTGRKVVTDSGRMLGTVVDMLIDEADGTLLGYTFDAANAPGLFTLLRRTVRSQALDYVRADADIRIGNALLVVPDEAIVHDHAVEAERPPAPRQGAPDARPAALMSAAERPEASNDAIPVGAQHWRSEWTHVDGAAPRQAVRHPS